MRKVVQLIIIVFFLSSSDVFGQTETFDQLNGNAGSNKKIEWVSSGYGSGYGHRIYNLDPGFGGKTLLSFAGRNNSTSWTDILTLTSNGKVGIGTTDPSVKFQVNGASNLFGDVTSTATTMVFNNNSEQNATIWLTKPTSGPSSIGHYYIKAFDWWGAYLHFQGAGDGGDERLNVTFDGKVGIGVTNPSAQLDILDEQVLGPNANDARLLARISGKTSNTLMNNVWLRRDSNGSNWLTTRLHDGISVDASYLNPGTDTKTWWERDPYHNIQSWGSSNQIYMTLKSGKLGIGTEDTGTHKLAVEGTIGAREIKVEASGWSDFVFENDYELPTLEEVESFITENKHLPEIPSEAEVAENGINLGEMDAKLLQKIEELTLYVIELNKQNQAQQMRIELLESKVED